MSQPKRDHGLSDLLTLPLDPLHAGRLAALETAVVGTPPWRGFKLSEARAILALDQIAPRMSILALDIATLFLAALRIVTPVPCRPPGSADVVVASEVDLVVTYPEVLLRQPIPGDVLVRILRPPHVHHPNVSPRADQRLCLGPSIPRGFPVREAILLSYAALSLQSIGLDEADPAGVLNLEATRFWQSNRCRIPLSREAFLDPPGGGA